MRNLVGFVASVAVSASIAALLVFPNTAESQIPGAEANVSIIGKSISQGFARPYECEGQGWPYQTDECANAIAQMTGLDRQIRVITERGI